MTASEKLTAVYAAEAAALKTRRQAEGLIEITQALLADLRTGRTQPVEEWLAQMNLATAAKLADTDKELVRLARELDEARNACDREDVR